MSSTRPRARARLHGFTLIELLVAITLMVILTGSVTFIFIQAQEIFSTVDAKVQVYQYARYAFDQMERDLSNVVRTRNQNFFNDQLSVLNPGNYDPGEEAQIVGTANRDGDPDGDRIYNFAFTVRQPEPYYDERGTPHRRDSIFFKTVTSSGGKTAATLVEYALIDTAKERPKMVKRTWRVTGVDSSNPLRPRYEINRGQLPPEQDLCLYCVDAKFEVFVQNKRRSDAGEFYEVHHLTQPDADGKLGPPIAAHGQRAFEPLHNYWAGKHRMIQCVYDIDHDDSFGDDLGVIEKDPKTGTYDLFRTKRGFMFPMLDVGDELLFYVGPKSQLTKPYEIKIKGFEQSNGKPWEPHLSPSELRIRLEHPVEPPPGAGNSLEVTYRAGWVPPALRVTLRIKDSKSKEIRSVGRTFKVMN